SLRRQHRYVTLDAHCFTPTILLFSEAVFRELSPDLQAIVEEAAREAVTWQRQATVKAEPEMLALLRREGVTLIELSPEEREAFVRAARTVREQLNPIVGDQAMAELRQALSRS